MDNYTFTESWFGVGPHIELCLSLEKDSEVHFLEIGTFEGRSTMWFLDKYLTNPNSTITCVDPWMDYSLRPDGEQSYHEKNPEWKLKTNNTKATFLSNLVKSGKANQVLIRQGFSADVLSALIVERKQFDFIFVDGNHTPAFVMMDAVLSWNLLKVGGVMAFDDYGDVNNPSLARDAIDRFIDTFSDYIEVLYRKDTAIIKKKRW